jgi:hypothetical protein
VRGGGEGTIASRGGRGGWFAEWNGVGEGRRCSGATSRLPKSNTEEADSGETNLTQK